MVCFAEAPFAHVHEHPSGADHHATEQAHVHTRLRPAETDGAAIDQIDPADDERLVNWFQTTEQSRVVLCVAPQRAEMPAPVADPEFVRSAPSVSNHDPPLDPNLQSRAPPVIPA
jgi:hypothetical protein